MKKVIKNTTHKQQAIDDKEFWKSQTPEYRLDVLEQLRLEAGNFLYEYRGGRFSTKPLLYELFVGCIRDKKIWRMWWCYWICV